MINATPSKPLIFGISPNNNTPAIIPTTDLYELIGPSTESSPLFIAFTMKALPTDPVIPPKIAYNQHSNGSCCQDILKQKKIAIILRIK